MTNFSTLKECCGQKVEEAKKLKKTIETDLILRDMLMLAEELPERLQKKDGKYIWDEMIELSTYADGNLSIIDNRATAYGWTFEIEFTESLRDNDYFDYSGKVYRVNNLNEHTFSGTCEKIQEIIRELDRAIAKMKENTDLNTWTYKYYSSFEDRYCDNLREVMSVVSGRIP